MTVFANTLGRAARRRCRVAAIATTGVLSALVGAPRPAHASDCMQGQPNCVCYATTPEWNVPPGSAVQTHSLNIPLSGMFDAIGEYRNHTMFAIDPFAAGGPAAAHGGPGHVGATWMIHTDANPQANFAHIADICSYPVAPASMNQPGTAATEDVFQYLYGTSNTDIVDGTGAGSTFASEPTFLSYQPPAWGNYGNGFGSGVSGVTDFGKAFSTFSWKLLASHPGAAWQLAPDLPGNEPTAYQAYWNGRPMQYSFHSFIDGVDPSYGELDSINGLFCASTGAFVETNLFMPPAPPGGISVNFYPGGFPQTKIYSNSVLFGAAGAPQTDTRSVGTLGVADPSSYTPGMSPAFNLWVDIYHFCDSSGGAILQGSCPDVCSHAANEVINYVVFGDPKDNTFKWQQVIGDPNFVANAITDDTLAGWTNGPVNRITLGDCSGGRRLCSVEEHYAPGASVWANGFYDQVQWNAGGPTIDCEPEPNGTGTTPTTDPNSFQPGD